MADNEPVKLLKGDASAVGMMLKSWADNKTSQAGTHLVDGLRPQITAGSDDHSAAAAAAAAATSATSGTDFGNLSSTQLMMD